MMLGKMTKGSNQPGMAERSLEIVFRGVKYAVCSDRQYADISTMVKLELINSGTSQDLVDGKAKELLDNRGITTMNALLGRMTTEEKEEMLNRYRYGGMWKAK